MDTATTEIYTLSLHDALPISIEISRLDMAGLPLCGRGRLGKLADSRQSALVPYQCEVSIVPRGDAVADLPRSEEHTSELQSHSDLVCRLLLEKKKQQKNNTK